MLMNCYTPLNTLTGAFVITRQLAAIPLNPTRIMPATGPASHKEMLK